MNLGTLDFDSRINNQAVKDADQIRQQILAKLQGIDVSVNIRPMNLDDVKRQIEDSIRNGNYNVNLNIDNSAIQPLSSLSSVAENLKKSFEGVTEAATKLSNATKNISTSSQSVDKSILRVSGSLRNGINVSSRYASGIMALFNINLAKQFLGNIIEIGGQLEKQRVSMGAILGDVTKANVLFDQIKELALKSPFGVVELDQYTKQLAAYGFEYNELYDMVKRLADISAGAGQDIGRLTLALGHVKAQTYLTGITMRQFSMNNIPMLKMLSEYYSELEGRMVKVSEVQKRISQRQVSYDDVIEQIKRLTNEGGMFYNMQEKISETLAAKWKNLRDAFSIMYGEIAESRIGDLLKGVASILTSLVRHWEAILKVMVPTVSAIGAYRAALALVVLWHERMIKAKIINFFQKLIGVLTSATKAHAAYSAVLKAIQGNWIALVASGIAFVGALYLLRGRTLSVDEATQKYNESIEKQNALLLENKNNAEMWAKTMTNVAKTDKERNTAYNELLMIYPNIFNDISTETALQLSLAEALERVKNAYEGKTAAQASSDLNEAERDLNEAEREYQRLKKDFNDIQEYVNENGLSGYIADNYIRLNRQLKAAEDQLKISRKNYEYAKKIKEETDARNNLIAENTEDEWFKKAKEAAKAYASLQPKEDKTWEEYFDTIEKRRSELQGKIDKLNPSSEASKTQLDIYNKEKKVVDYIYKTILGGAEKQSVINKEESAELKKQREEVNRLKEIYSEFGKLKKDLGEKDALVKIGAMYPDKLDTTSGDNMVESYRKALTDVFNSTKDEGLKTQITKAIFNLDENILKENADKALAIINEEIDRQSNQFNLYKSIFEKTGDRAFASKAFSDGRIWDEQATVLANRLSEIVGKANIDFSMSDYDAKETFKGISGAYELWKKIVEITSGKYQDDLAKAADAMADIQTTEQKIAILQEQISEWENDTTGLIDHGAQIEEARRKIEELKQSLFSTLPVYEQIFGDMAYRSISSIKEAIRQMNEIIENATEKKDPKTGKAKSISSSYIDTEGVKQNVNLSLSEFRKLKERGADLRKAWREKNPFSLIAQSIKNLREKLKDKNASPEEKVEQWASFAATLSECADVVSELAGKFSDMFDALGNGAMADAMSDIQAGADSISNISKGFANGGVFGMAIAAAGEVAGWIGRIASKHDKKIDKAIQKSQLEVKKLENAYKNLQYTVNKQLTKITKEQSSTLLKNLKQQRAEIEKQQELESKKKKKDQSKLVDYQQQIEELNQEIADFYEELASDRYDVSIDSWAGKISDAITDAFASGEDAAKAFNDTVADIMKDVVSNIVKIGVVKPAMDKLQEYLFGENGIATTNSEEGIEISANEAAGLVAQLSGLKDTIGQAKDIWNIINDAAKQAGIDMAKSSSEGLSKGIQGMTENTADLLASYVNAIRADVAYIRMLQEGNGTDPIAQAQLQSMQTLVTLAQERNTRIDGIYDMLTRASKDKSFGFYVR